MRRCQGCWELSGRGKKVTGWMRTKGSSIGRSGQTKSVRPVGRTDFSGAKNYQRNPFVERVSFV
ncbi:hypothetical protein ABER69_27800 [Bacillus paranthracis]|uniref:hypothetical protein n=1 Tax=Bacillus paranthracis TaxID=2026186 RepID=UPI003D23FF21